MTLSTAAPASAASQDLLDGRRPRRPHLVSRQHSCYQTTHPLRFFPLVLLFLTTILSYSSMQCFTMALSSSYPFSSHYNEDSASRPLIMTSSSSYNPNESSMTQVRSMILSELSKRVLQEILETNKGENHALRRQLQSQDFKELNELLKSVTVILPEFSFSAGSFMFVEATITARYTKCVDLSIQNLQVLYERTASGNTLATLDVLVDGLGFDCEIFWEYDWIGSGSGLATLNTTDNSFGLEFSLTSQNFDTEPPTAVSISQCTASIEINDIDAKGGFVAFIIDAVEGLMRGPIERQINGLICEEASALSGLLQALVDDLNVGLESYRGVIPDELLDPLFPEKSLSESSSLANVELIDLTTTDYGEAINMIFDYVNDYFGGRVEDAESPTGTGEDLSINKIMRNFILNENRALVLNGTMFGTVVEGEDLLTRSKISVDSIHIYGLDTLTEFVPIERIGRHTIASSLYWPLLKIGVVLDVEVSPSEAQDSVIDGGLGTVRELIEVAIEIEQTEIDLALMFAIGKMNITDLAFGSFSDVQSIVSCVADTIYDVEISNLSVIVGGVIAPTLDGFISSGIDNVVSSLSFAVFDMYEGTLLSILSRLFQVDIRNNLNDAIDAAINNSEKCNYRSATSDDPINLPDLMLLPEDATSVGGSGTSPYGTLFPLVFDSIIDEVEKSIVSGTIDLNEMIRAATLAQSGFGGSLFYDSLVDVNTEFELGSVSLGLQLKVYNTSIQNLDTLGLPFDVLNPTAPYSIGNSVPAGVSNKQLKAKTNVMFAIDVPGSPTLTNDLEISIGMKNLVLNMVLFVSLIERKVMNLPVKSMTNLNCLVSMLSIPSLDENGYRRDDNKTLYFETLSLVGEDSDFGIKCKFCSSPDINLLVSILGTASSFIDASGIINSIFDLLVDLLKGNAVQTSIDRYVASAPYKCPSDAAYNASYVNPQFSALEQFSTVPEPANKFFRNFAIMLSILFSVIIAIMIIVRRYRYKVIDKWINEAPAKELAVEKEKQDLFKQRGEKLNAQTSAIFCSKVVPLPVRLLIPLVIIGNVGLFLSGHLSLGAQVDLIIDIAGEALTLPKLFEFSLAGSVRDMWQNGAKELAVFISIFSGIWPYTKQTITFFLWFAPTKWVTVQKRGSILLWLDALGKWSFVDIFVLIMSLVGFRIAVKSPELPLLSTQIYSIDLLVIPKWGLYANMIAQLVSQISSHFIIHYHRKILNDCLQSEAATEDRSRDKKALCGHSFRVLGSEKGSPSRFFNMAVVLLAITAVAVLIVGCILNIFTIESFGLIGVAIELGQNFNDAIERFSFFDILKLIVNQAIFTGVTSDYIGLGSLSVIFVWTVLVVPLLQIVLLLYRWFAPMNTKQRYFNFVLVETLMAWQYSEVFILSVIIGAWQLGPISEYMVNDYCGALDDFFLSAVSYGVLSSLDGQCFRAEGSVNNGGWFLSLGAIALAILTQIVNRAAMQQVQEIEVEDEIRRKYQDPLEDDAECVIDYPKHDFADYFGWSLKSK